ncbi:GNAT family N-acetyltransferase [Fodinibius salsisoli]|uniref:N-acetyltransferase n=1 Tax=Fodinibius salsisoli TaxID=2820877 RepID=A0ABT3PLU0_9BACT|nr:GNAT family N-acetyltransferase [Fodinibius salsisoli]MCW9706688.1 N-acetyltransferase [Fodinibius salsisoli]
MISLAQPSQLESINRIYNQAVRDGFRTAHSQPVDINYRHEWFSRHPEECYPVFVYLEEDEVAGWLSVSAYRPGRQALNEVVEVSYYVDYNHQNRGIATQLMKQAVAFSTNQNYRILVAILLTKNAPSIRLLEHFGFEEGGRIPDAYHHQDEFRDHLYFYKRLDT